FTGCTGHARPAGTTKRRSRCSLARHARYTSDRGAGAARLAAAPPADGAGATRQPRTARPADRARRLAGSGPTLIRAVVMVGQQRNPVAGASARPRPADAQRTKPGPASVLGGNWLKIHAYRAGPDTHSGWQ